MRTGSATGTGYGARARPVRDGRHAGGVPAVIEAVLRSHEPFAEELFDTLLDHLGFPPAPDPEAGAPER
ncbi:hypothetical protein OHA91_17010 [Streptomyces erythrochromogenes]|uniref:Uncharacterized protein n=1 Tax=Streptomyces erythrochromogenes TaxID=285574 RepID=A0ABZ1QCK1_9ACTN|nr:hypothetical protein [Streptomyces erythrochromogenes]